MMNYEALDEALEYIEAVNEGVNADITTATTKMRKDYREAIKRAKARIKLKEFKEAKKDIADARKVLEDYDKFLESTSENDTTKSNVIGGLIYTGFYFAKVAVPFAIAIAGLIVAKTQLKKLDNTKLGDTKIYIPKLTAENIRKSINDHIDSINKIANRGENAANVSAVASITGLVIAILNTCKDLVEFKEIADKDKAEGKDPDNNSYRVQCRASIKRLASNLKKLEDNIDKLEEK